MDIKSIKRAYFIGIGGIGMSALARFFLQHGVAVNGYDRTASPLTRRLEEEGAGIHYREDVSALDPEATLVVYTPAISQDHAELCWYRENHYKIYKRSEVLQWILEKKKAVTVAGTHGKTTISAMVAYLLREAGYGGEVFLGGITVNYNTNYWRVGHSDIAVVEADEYDRSFLKLQPDIAVLSAMDADHLDIYGSVENMEEAFIQYTGNITQDGILIAKHGLKRMRDMKAPRTVTYSLQNNAADYYAGRITQHQGGYIFEMRGPGLWIEDIRLDIGGMHNVENMVAALAVCHVLDISPVALKEAVPGFKGVRRRFEYVIKKEQQVYIDDYAHHPQELAALISSAKRMFPGRKCVIAFQPHLFSRTKDLAEDFAASLDLADEVLLLDIYPAREKPIEGVTSQIIADKMQNQAHTLLSKEGLVSYVKAAKPSLFITAGAGDIDQLVPEIKMVFNEL